jgi:hypothetical protein
MLKILNIGDETYQRHLILFEEQEIELKLRYLATQEIWVMDIKYKDTQILNVKLSINVLHIRNFNLPFDFIVIDNSGEGIDPFLKDDFKSNRCTLYLVEASEMEEIRGLKVEI